jgi:NADPH-dependent 2,4-dienoyl-CoA reductase/sulfur reductase-like enzyme
MADRGVVIVGAGLAAAHVASTIREAGDQRPVTIIGDEGRRPYERPGLSKAVLQGKDEPDSLYVHDAELVREQGIVRLGFEDPAVGLDLAERDGTADVQRGCPSYADLVIATGARPRTLDFPGVDLPGVHSLRRIPDSLALRESFAEGRRLVVIGAGWIGLEVAAAASEAGVEVTVLEYGRRPARAALGDRMGTYFADLHRSHGVDAPYRCGRHGDRGSGAVTGVRTGDELFPADIVVVGVGAVPNTELAEAAGLTSTTASSWTTSSAPASTSSRSATSPTPPTRLSERGARRALGQRDPPGQARRPRAPRRGRAVRLAAVLLHRPVRPRHGVRRPRHARRRRRACGGARSRASSSRSGSGKASSPPR